MPSTSLRYFKKFIAVHLITTIALNLKQPVFESIYVQAYYPQVQIQPDPTVLFHLLLS